MDELTRMNGFQLVDELVAWMRQLCFVQAKLYETMTQIAHLPVPESPTGPDSPVERSEFPEEFAVDELRVALCWTKQYANRELGTALRLVEDLPKVHQALKHGRIQPRIAEDIANATTHLNDAEAVEVADKLLDDIEKAAADSDGFGGLTTGQVRGRLRRRCVEADPESAKKRYKQAVEDRRFVAEQNPDGTADIIACNAPADRAARVKARVQATVEQIKRHGLAAGRTMDQIRADALLDYAEGLDPLAATTTPSSTPASSSGGSVEVTIPFDTLTGLADQPGELGGWGPVLADVARQVVERQRNGRWLFSVTDPPTGQLLDQVLTRRRPPAEMARFVRARDKTCRNPACRAPAQPLRPRPHDRHLRRRPHLRGEPRTRTPTRPPSQTPSRLAPRTTPTRRLRLDHRHRPQTHHPTTRPLNGLTWSVAVAPRACRIRLEGPARCRSAGR